MTKRAYELYHAIGSLEDKLLAIRGRLIREEIGPELAAIKARSVSIELSDLAINVFSDTPK